MTYDEILEKLPIHITAPNVSAYDHPILLTHALRLRDEAYAEKVRAERVMEVAEAEVAIELRESGRAVGDKLTETALKELVTVDHRVRRATRRFNDALVEEERTKLLLDALRQRGNMVRIQADLVRFESSGSDVSELEENLKRRYPGQK